MKLSGIGCSSKSPAYFMNRSHSFNSVHGRMPSVATGATLANRTMTGLSVSGDGVSQVTNRVAGGMQATADWLREADMDSMRTGVERQVKEHPGRTLLIAVGLGYLLGKAFRK